MILYKNKKLVIPTGINPHYLEDSSVLNNQDKEITITSNGKTTLVHDPGFSGLGTVKINTYVGEQVIQPFYSTTITENGDYDIFPDEGYDAIAELEVTVDVQPELQDKTVDSSTNEQVITHDSSVYGLSSVTVNPYVLDEKAVDSSTNEQVITSDVDGLKSVTVVPYVLTSLELDSSTHEQITTGQFGSVKINPYILDDLTLDSSTNSQLVEGQYGTVTVNPYVLDSSSLTVTENGEYAIESSADGLSRVDVSVNIDTQSYYDSGYSAGEADGIVEGKAEQKALLDSSTFTENGTYTRENGWDEVTVDVPSDIHNQSKTVDSSTNSQIITADVDYSGLGQVTINPYVLDSSTLDSSTVVQTITGQFSSVTVNPYRLQYKANELSPTYRDTDANGGVIRIEPDNGYDGLSAFQYRLPSVLNSKTFDCSTAIQTYDTASENTYVKGIKEIIINPVTSSIDANIVAENIKSGVTILGVTGDYEGGGTVVPGKPYISNKGTGRGIYLGVSGYDTTGQDVQIRCIFSIPTGGTYSAADVSNPLSTTNCIVGFGGDGTVGAATQQAVGIAYGRSAAGTGANRLYTFYGAQVYDMISTNVYPGNEYNYDISCIANDSDDDEGCLYYCTRAYKNNFAVLINSQSSWKASGNLLNHGSWAAFQWDTGDDTYGSALTGTRIYEIHLRIGTDMYDFYPVSTNGQVGFAKYTNGVFTANILASTDYFEYGVYY